MSTTDDDLATRIARRRVDDSALAGVVRDDAIARLDVGEVDR